MKLYFYILEKSYVDNKKPYVRFEECEVIEKPKTYYPVSKFPDGVYSSFIRKEDIGHVSGGHFNNLVILTEPNIGMAKEIFKGLYENEIKQIEKSLVKLKIILDAILEMRRE